MPEAQSTSPGAPVLRTLVLLEPLDGGLGRQLLFDRPLDAVRFCLSWHEAGQGRAAIHLGEVFPGASGSETEGPARTAALRLLPLARPGQTLLTRTAFDLARRAAVGEELGEGIEWRAHGACQSPLDGGEIEVFEVGRAPLAALALTPAVRRWRPEAGQTVPHRPHWVLEKRLEGATFGEIWLARHLKTGDRRALRFCLDPGDLPRLRRHLGFLRQIRERLADPTFTVRPVDSQLAQEPFFLESEHLGAEPLPLWAEARGGLDRVPLETRRELGRQLAEAVAALHSVGIGLGPLDPFNLLVRPTEEGAPRLLLAELSQCLALPEAPPGSREADLRSLDGFLRTFSSTPA